MSLFRLIMFWALGLPLLSCTSQQKQMEVELAGESYGGIIPCADCEGIAYRISFFANSKFRNNLMYLGKDNKKFMEKGYWKVKEDSTIVLTTEQKGTRKLKRKGDELLILDQTGKEIQGPLARRYILRNNKIQPLEATVERDSGSTVDFKAHGNEPFWELKIDFDKMMSFRMPSGDSVNTPVPKVNRDSVSQIHTYKAAINSERLIVALHPTGCMDSMSGQVYNYRIVVRIKKEKYSGCGDFVPEADSLAF